MAKFLSIQDVVIGRTILLATSRAGMCRKKFAIALSIVFLLVSPPVWPQDFIKKPSVSGQFYPAESKDINQFIDDAFLRHDSIKPDEHAGVLIVPHAGYAYSGLVAAAGYRTIAAGRYTTIVLIGPSHYHSFAGASIWPEGEFHTPLGSIAVDETLAKQLMAADANLRYIPEAFHREHSLEVQLPFVQKTFKGISIVPILMGNPDPEVCLKLAQALHKAIGERKDVLVIISTDFSHYLDGQTAKKMDERTIQIIHSGDMQALWNEIVARKIEMCGWTSVITGVLYAQLKNLKQSKLLSYAHSGDVTGDNARVVGYASLIFSSHSSGLATGKGDNETSNLNAAQQNRLIEIARNTINEFVLNSKRLMFEESDPQLNEFSGAFVTIRMHGALRGCIGAFSAKQPLFKTVGDMAIAAASEDPRFPALSLDELKDYKIEISVLSQPVKISYPQKEIQLGTHGVILSRGGINRGVFLPQVAEETGWSFDEFMRQLCVQKAGLSDDCWKDPQTTIEIFTAQVFGE